MVLHYNAPCTAQPGNRRSLANWLIGFRVNQVSVRERATIASIGRIIRRASEIAKAIPKSFARKLPPGQNVFAAQLK